jgi:hypothetical protein
MSTRARQDRLAGAFDWNTGGPPDVVGHLLRWLGADPAFVDDVLGDLAEEHARRTVERGAVAARWWYLAEAVRALPHLAWNALRFGGTRGRARVAAVVAGVAMVPAVIAAGLMARAGAPARLVVEAQNGADPRGGLIVNTRHPVRLSMLVYDREGRSLSTEVVRYRLIAGAPFDISEKGVVTCSRSGDAAVRAYAGSAVTTLIVRCRPVREVRSYKWVQLVAGDSAHELSFEALAPDGGREHLLAGARFVTDTTVARLEGSSLRGVAPGGAMLVTEVGDGRQFTRVSVFEPVPSLDGLRPDQQFVIAPVRVARGAAITWPLPQGLYWLKYHRASPDDPLPALTVAGGMTECVPAFGPGVARVHCLSRAPGATLHVASTGSASFTGKVSLEVEKQQPEQGSGIRD